MTRGLHKTDIEVIMQTALAREGIKVVPQYPIRSRFGYILDFAIPDLKIDIECDGENFHKEGNSRDRKRNWFLRNRGWRVIRFTGKEIKENINSCLIKLKEEIKK